MRARVKNNIKRFTLQRNVLLFVLSFTIIYDTGAYWETSTAQRSYSGNFVLDTGLLENKKKRGRRQTKTPHKLRPLIVEHDKHCGHNSPSKQPMLVSLGADPLSGTLSVQK